jgi:lysophospholipase L1-like esterase
VFIEFAVNDSVARFNLPLDEARAKLTTMVDRIRAALPDCVIALQVMNPVIGRPEGHAGHRPHLDAYYQMYRDVAAGRKLVLIDHAPAWRAVLDRGEDGFRQLAPDGLHPNATGCEQIVTPGILATLGLAPKAH